MLNGEVCPYPCHDTLQVANYSRYDMASFDADRKRLSREKNFRGTWRTPTRSGRGWCARPASELLPLASYEGRGIRPRSLWS